MSGSSRQILAAAFPTRDGASRAAAAVAGAFPDKVGNAAVLSVGPDGKARFTEARDWGAGRGALLGGAIGIIGGPLGILAGGTIGALAAKLRDSGFDNDQLERLGTTLNTNSSAVVIEIADEAVADAKQILQPLGALEVVTQPLDSSVADVFQGQQAPQPEPELEAASSPA